ncbi:MAG: 2,3-diaminopropionate biosynthesis protein SbnB [Gammaproteobacteria bacterium]|nr:2,3-diaminopropionate biosynthesis protein SbnB [Gammaproteobacteria bacterium]
MNTPNFTIINAEYIKQWLLRNPNKLLEITTQAYLSFHEGTAVNPDSYFLRFPDNPNNRIIALPASSEKDPLCAGIKWISSFPINISNGLDRASAVFVLNDRKTGYPLACLEGSQISSYRTAASAIVGADLIHPTKKYSSHMVIVGCGLISHSILSLMIGTGWSIDKITLIDLNLDRADIFAKKFNNLKIETSKKLVSGDLILFATSAIEPYILDTDILNNNPTILHMSLRDLGVELIEKSQNFVDDIEHSVKANTSLYLTEEKIGNRNFITGDIAQLIEGKIEINPDKPRIYAPFGMGIIDLLVGQAVYQEALLQNSNENISTINNFFPTPYTEISGE